MIPIMLFIITYICVLNTSVIVQVVGDPKHKIKFLINFFNSIQTISKSYHNKKNSNCQIPLVALARTIIVLKTINKH